MAVYTAPVITTFEGKVLAQSGAGGPNYVPALSTWGVVAMGAGLATVGAYRLLKSRHKKPRGRDPKKTKPPE